MRTSKPSADESVVLRVSDLEGTNAPAADMLRWRFLPQPNLVFTGEEVSKEVTLELTGLLRDGDYTAKVQAWISDDKLAGETSLTVSRRPIAFEPTLEGRLVDGNQVRYIPETANDVVFGFSVRNPPDGKVRCLQLEPAKIGNQSGLDVTFEFEGEPPRDICEKVRETTEPGAAEADFAPGQGRAVLATIEEPLTAGTYVAPIVVTDPAETDARKSFALSVEPRFTSWRPNIAMIYTFFAVLAGSGISVFLNYAAPLMISKGRWRSRLGRALKEMRELRDERLRLRLENDRQAVVLKQAGLWLGTAESEQSSVETDLGALEQKVSIAAEIERVREYHRRTPRLPLSHTIRVFDHLRDAAWHLINGRVEQAKKDLEAAESIMLLQTYFANAIDRIDSLTPKDLGRFGHDLDYLKKKITNLRTQTVPETEISDLTTRLVKLELLVDRFDNGIALSDTLVETLSIETSSGNIETPDECKRRLRNELLSLLERSGTDALEAAAKMVRCMETGYLSDQIVKRLEKGNGEIDVDPQQPNVGELAVFTLTLGEPYDRSVAAKELTYRWSVPGTSLSSSGKRCFIVFDRPGIDYHIEVEVKRSNGVWVGLNDKGQGFSVAPRRAATSFVDTVWSAQSGIFLATVVLASVLAWTMHFGAFEITEFRDLFVPFLIVIGIDQFREKITAGQMQATEIIRGSQA